MNTPIFNSFTRLSDVPIDDKSVFQTKAEAEAYISDEKSSAYIGQIITTIEDFNRMFIVQEEEGKKVLISFLGEEFIIHRINEQGAIAYDHSQIADGTNPHLTTFANIEEKPTTLEGYGITDGLNSSLKGSVNGLAELDENGKVLSSQLPSYVDDVLEFESVEFFPEEGENSKIYIALDTNKTFRWGGTEYAEISASLALGETSSTAFRGDWGKTAYDHSQLASGNPHNVSKNDLELENVDNTSDEDKPVSTAQATALDLKVDKVLGKELSTNDLTNTLKGNYDTAYANNHTHSNKEVLDNTTASYTTEEKTKVSNLSGINTGDQDLSGYVPTNRAINGYDLSSDITISKSDVGLGNAYNPTAYGGLSYGGGNNEEGVTFTNLNSLVYTGFYTCYGTTTNAPSASYSWFIQHINSNVGNVSATQIATAYATTNIIYKRNKISSTWGAWENISPSLKLDKTTTGSVRRVYGVNASNVQELTEIKTTAIENSTDLITSGGVYTILGNIETLLAEV